MKKYFLGLLAIVLAIAFSAFTKPSKNLAGDKLFRYNQLLYSKSLVQNLSKWNAVDETQECAGSANKACEILVDKKYYHDNGYGVFVLNNNAYIISTFPAPEVPDEEMFITATQGGIANKYIVQLWGTMVANQAAIDNKD